MKKAEANTLRDPLSVYGQSMMAVGSLFNHSCDANTISETLSDHMVVVAAHPIEKGKQVIKQCNKILISVFLLVLYYRRKDLKCDI